MNAVHVSVVDGETEVLLGEEVSPLTVRVAERAFRKALREEGLTAGEGEVVLLEREVRVYLQGLEVVWEKRGRCKQLGNSAHFFTPALTCSHFPPPHPSEPLRHTKSPKCYTPPQEAPGEGQA